MGIDRPVAFLVLIFTATTIDLHLASILHTSTEDQRRKVMGHGYSLENEISENEKSERSIFNLSEHKVQPRVFIKAVPAMWL